MGSFARRFQVELLPDVPWGELRRRVRHAEDLGFDVATTADQFVDWKNPTIPWFDVWATLAAFAEATDRIRLAPCVAQIPMRDPATYVRSVLTVDHVPGGRIEAGLGLGLTVDPGYGMIGVQNWASRPCEVDRSGRPGPTRGHLSRAADERIDRGHVSCERCGRPPRTSNVRWDDRHGVPHR